TTNIVFYFSYYADPRELHSFPTRRSSDLSALASVAAIGLSSNRCLPASAALIASSAWTWGGTAKATASHRSNSSSTENAGVVPRSEEHTSELQSLAYLVCRLLLEKKKQRD